MTDEQQEIVFQKYLVAINEIDGRFAYISGVHNGYVWILDLETQHVFTALDECFEPYDTGLFFDHDAVVENCMSDGGVTVVMHSVKALFKLVEPDFQHRVISVNLTDTGNANVVYFVEDEWDENHQPDAYDENGDDYDWLDNVFTQSKQVEDQTGRQQLSFEPSEYIVKMLAQMTV